MREGYKPIMLEMTINEHEAFKEFCKRERTTMSAYLRKIVLDKIKKVLKEGEKNVSREDR